MNREIFSSKKIALNGILLAFTVVVLLVATIIPTNRLSLYALSSFFISIAILEHGVKYGWLFYLSSVLLSAIIVQNKVGLIPFILFFGVYGVIKYYIEKIGRLVVEYILKIVYFNINLVIAVLFVKQFFPDIANSRFPWWLVVIGLEIAFIAYDYAYTLFIQYYNSKLKKRLKL